jgi:hypothetical protein
MIKHILLGSLVCIAMLGCTDPTPENMCHGSMLKDDVVCLRYMVDSLRFDIKLLQQQAKYECRSEEK